MDERVELAMYRAPRMKSNQYRKRKRAPREVVFLMKFAVAVLLSFTLIVLLACNATRKRTMQTMEVQYEQRLAQERVRIEEQIKAEYGLGQVDQQNAEIDLEAKAIAKVLYPMRFNNQEGLKSAVWCVINRAESHLYPDTIQEVCSQDQQWMGWSEDNPVLDNLYTIAYEQLQVWHNGSTRPLDRTYLFMEWNTKEITLRTTFDGKNGCHYWYEDDWND